MKINAKILENFVGSTPSPQMSIYKTAFSIDRKNYKFAVKIILSVSNNFIESIDWEDINPIDVSYKIEKNVKNSAKIIQQYYPLSTIDEINMYLPDIHRFFGGTFNPKNGFTVMSKGGYIPILHERQITEGLAECLNLGDKHTFHERVLCFLEALLPSKEIVQVLKNLNDDEKSNIKVKAEYETYKKKRIDILISWNVSNNTYGVAVEAKFGHKVTSSQLPTYRNYCKNNYKGNYELVLLTIKGEKKSNNAEWNSCSWFNLLIRLEKRLVERNCDDDRFSSFRAMVWKKIGGMS